MSDKQLEDSVRGFVSLKLILLEYEIIKCLIAGM